MKKPTQRMEFSWFSLSLLFPYAKRLSVGGMRFRFLQKAFRRIFRLTLSSSSSSLLPRFVSVSFSRNRPTDHTTFGRSSDSEWEFVLRKSSFSFLFRRTSFSSLPCCAFIIAHNFHLSIVLVKKFLIFCNFFSYRQIAGKTARKQIRTAWRCNFQGTG